VSAELERYERKQSWSDLGSCSDICQEGLRKITKCPSQNRRSPDLNLISSSISCYLEFSVNLTFNGMSLNVYSVIRYRSLVKGKGKVKLSPCLTN
jgi:hypothetical protein